MAKTQEEGKIDGGEFESLGVGVGEWAIMSTCGSARADSCDKARRRKLIPRDGRHRPHRKKRELLSLAKRASTFSRENNATASGPKWCLERCGQTQKQDLLCCFEGEAGEAKNRKHMSREEFHRVGIKISANLRFGERPPPDIDVVRWIGRMDESETTEKCIIISELIAL